ncbi:hypothetical protein JB92DRAFT_2832166 [Gautieria morchelliformis]|nr:hypothetical protein JB92DRAFT_2832166 [Gautieria morchelliformis]
MVVIAGSPAFDLCSCRQSKKGSIERRTKKERTSNRQIICVSHLAVKAASFATLDLPPMGRDLAGCLGGEDPSVMAPVVDLAPKEEERKLRSADSVRFRLAEVGIEAGHLGKGHVELWTL